MSPRPAGGKTPGQHGPFVVAVKQERSEAPRAVEKGPQEEEVSPHLESLAPAQQHSLKVHTV